jgi:hypothetical protein
MKDSDFITFLRAAASKPRAQMHIQDRLDGVDPREVAEPIEVSNILSSAYNILENQRFSIILRERLDVVDPFNIVCQCQQRIKFPRRHLSECRAISTSSYKPSHKVVNSLIADWCQSINTYSLPVAVEPVMVEDINFTVSNIINTSEGPLAVSCHRWNTKMNFSTNPRVPELQDKIRSAFWEKGLKLNMMFLWIDAAANVNQGVEDLLRMATLAITGKTGQPYSRCLFMLTQDLMDAIQADLTINAEEWLALVQVPKFSDLSTQSLLM